MKIHRMNVDFVNLRANEIYGADSRIPTFGTPSSGGDPPGPPTFGAPLEDALRRKVSRERVGKELEGMLSGKHAPPGSALDAIARLCTWRCRCSPSRGRSLAIGSAWAAP